MSCLACKAPLPSGCKDSLCGHCKPQVRVLQQEPGRFTFVFNACPAASLRHTYTNTHTYGFELSCSPHAHRHAPYPFVLFRYAGGGDL